MNHAHIERWSAEEAIRYDDFASRSFSWHYIEAPSLRTLIAPHITTDTVALDLGCGGGRVISLLRVLGVTEDRIYGLDSNQTLLELARRRFPRARLIRGELRAPPYFAPPVNLDLVTAHLVLQYLSPDDLSTCLSETHRLLKPGGLLAVGLPHPIRVIEQAESCYFSRQRHVVRAPWGGMTTWAGLTVADYANAAIKAGLRIIRLDEPDIHELGLSHRDAQSYSHGPTRLMMLLRKPEA